MILGDKERITDTHVYFLSGPFSQWYKSKFIATNYNDSSIENKFVTAEQYMMFTKAIVFDDNETAQKILKTSSPKLVKDLGRQVNNYKEEIWSSIRFDVVVQGNIAKFSQDELLKKYLKSTEDKILVEAAPYDIIWGVGLSQTDNKILDNFNWLGQNLLGKALMKARDSI